MEKKLKILLAEDDKNLGNILKTFLEAKDYSTKLCANGQEAFDAFVEDKYDVCLVDVMMPIKDGYTLAHEIRQMDKYVPIIFLTAKSMEEDKLQAFDVGADDYLTKPFSMEELLVRIKAILRRVNPDKLDETPDVSCTFGKFTLNYNLQILYFEKKEQKLTTKENQLLKILCQNQNQIVDRSVALKKIWHDDSYFNARSMDVYVTKLRKYLKDDPKVELINVHGIGFKLVVKK
jgi:DNA-binding response OmpR family regulator